MCSSSHTVSATIAEVVHNDAPRLDVDGHTVNAHQGSVRYFPHLGKYLWIGSAWVPCANEPAINGCANMTYGACGFDNNGIAIYSSSAISNRGWQVETRNVLPLTTRATGEYWEPNIAFNPTTSSFVVWYIFSAPNTTLGVVQVATASSPSGPWLLVNRNVTLRYPSFTSAELFVEHGDGYVLYSSQQPHAHPMAVVERLDSTWTRSTGKASPPFGGSAGGEGEVLFERKGVYYMLEGGLCCFCRGGICDIGCRTAGSNGTRVKR